MKHYIIFSITALIINAQHTYSMELIPAPTSSIKDKLVDTKSYSVEDWKRRQLLLMDFKGFIDNPCTRKRLSQNIKKTRKMITLKERELDLKAIVSYIRQKKTANIDDLREYRTKLEMFVQKLPESALK